MHLRGYASTALAHSMNLRHLYVISGAHKSIYQNLRRQYSSLAAYAYKYRAFILFHGNYFSLLEMAPLGHT